MVSKFILIFFPSDVKRKRFIFTKKKKTKTTKRERESELVRMR